jgi:hypothetical protein
MEAGVRQFFQVPPDCEFGAVKKGVIMEDVECISFQAVSMHPRA